MKTIKNIWDKFENDVIPKDASKTQRTEMQRAFYAGGFQLMQLMLHETTNLSEDEGAKAMMTWETKFQEYFIAMLMQDIMIKKPQTSKLF